MVLGRGGRLGGERFGEKTVRILERDHTRRGKRRLDGLCYESDRKTRGDICNVEQH